MQVIVTYSEYGLPFNENENYSPGIARSGGSIQGKKSPVGAPGMWCMHRR